MSHKIIILQHTPLVTPGYFTKLMNEDLVETTIIRLDEGEKIPVNLDIFDGMICLGGPMDTWMEEQYPWMIDEKNKIKEFVLNNQKPYLGICLGCQFLGEILGGKVIKSNPPEIGILNINILDNKKKDQIFQNFDNQINSYATGKLKNFKISYSFEGSSLQKKIWKELSKIKYGKVSTYGEIAKKVGTSPRYVGNVCGQNKLLLIIPCHRIIRSDGKLGGFSGRRGVKLKKRLLNLEQSVS